ncbi:MAG: hypothetical protein K2N98_00880, partial [Lachnospiraceae bacterium]|nr:hypothetical protein [Lachnospiraceae bacterium]
MNQNKSAASHSVYNLPASVRNVNGPLRFNMMNDYMFRADLIDNRMNWQNRSLLYLCRSYDQLGHGQEYTE